MNRDDKSLGYIVGGGLREGLRVRLTVPADQIQEGSFVVCDSGRFRFYGLVTDLQLGATDPRFADEASDRMQKLIKDELLGKTLYTTLEMYSTLMLDQGPDFGSLEREAFEKRVERGLEGPKPVKTVPTHHSLVRAANAADVAEIFGVEGEKRLVIGHTIEQEHPIRLDLERFVQRSSGIFGATGTGKSFLTRMVLAGLICKDVASALVFDMHNEYAFDDQDSDNRVIVRGLQSLFGQRVQVAALGAGATVRGHNPDFTLELATRDFEIGDIKFLADTLKLTDTATYTLNALAQSFADDWFGNFMEMNTDTTVDPDSGKKQPAEGSVAAWSRKNNVHEAAAEALHRRLKDIYNRPYVKRNPAGNAVKDIVDKLENARHVILSFGDHEEELDYLLVTNILTRHIRRHWVDRTNEKKKGLFGPQPRPLVIAVEEAHKLLNPQVSKQTAFGTIAREMRKYFVTLLVIDQRPSGIDDEVMSQLGTRITGWLGDADDIRAVLTGLAGREQLRGMLARLQEKEEVLLLGWGVKMPIPIRSRRYDDGFYREMQECNSDESGTSPLPDEYGMEDANKDFF